MKKIVYIVVFLLSPALCALIINDREKAIPFLVPGVQNGSLQAVLLPSERISKPGLIITPQEARDAQTIIKEPRLSEELRILIKAQPDQSASMDSEGLLLSEASLKGFSSSHLIEGVLQVYQDDRLDVLNPELLHVFTRYKEGTLEPLSVETLVQLVALDRLERLERNRTKERFLSLYAHPSYQQGLAFLSDLNAAMITKEYVVARDYAKKAFLAFHQAYFGATQRFADMPYTIDSSDDTNVAVMVFKTVVSLYLMPLQKLIRDLNEAAAQKKPIFSLIQEAIASVADADAVCAGDTGLIQYFNVPQEMSSLYQAQARVWYKSKRDPLVYRLYATIIEALFVVAPKPTNDVRQSAVYEQLITLADMYAAFADELWNVDLKISGAASAEQARADLKHAHAMLYVYSAQHCMASVTSLAALGEDKVVFDRNMQLVARAAAAYRTASEIYKTIHTDPSYVQFFTLYSTLAFVLESARASYDRALVAEKLSEKLRLYEQAVQGFSAGGATVLANTVSQILFEQSASAVVEQVKKELPFSLAFVNHAAFHEITEALAQKVKKMSSCAEQYVKAALLYKQAGTVAATNKSGEYNNQADAFEKKGTWLLSVSKILDSITDALTAYQKNMPLGTDYNERILQQLLTLSLLDASAVSSVGSDVVVLPITPLIKRLVADVYLGFVKEKMAEPVTPAQQAMLYDLYLFLFSLQDVLIPEERERLRESLESVDLLRHAQELIDAARKNTQWASRTSFFYESSALQSWRIALDAAFTAYVAFIKTGKFVQAPQVYKDALEECTDLYVKHVSSEINHEGYGALLYYRRYMVSTIDEPLSKQQELLATVQKYVQAYFLYAHTSVSLVMSAHEPLQKRIDAAQALGEWQRSLDTLLLLQQPILEQWHQFGQIVKPLYEKRREGNGTVLYTTFFPSVSFQVNEIATIGELYMRQGAAYEGQRDDVNAIAYYQRVAQLYAQYDMTPQKRGVDETIEYLRIRISAQILSELPQRIDENGTTFPGFVVFERAYVARQMRMIPDDIKLSHELITVITALSPLLSFEEQKDLQKTQSASVRASLLHIAHQVYLYEALRANNLLERAVPDVATLIAQPDRTENLAIKRLTKEALLYRQRLEQLIDSGVGSLPLQIYLFIQPKGISLVVENMQVPLVPHVSHGTLWQPTVSSYYARAEELYAKIGEHEQVARMQHNQALCFIGHAALLYKKIAYLKGHVDDGAIKKLVADEEEWSVLQEARRNLKRGLVHKELSNDPVFVEALNLVVKYYVAMIMQLQSALAFLSSDAERMLIHQYCGRSYEELAVMLTTHCVGDPRDAVYMSFVTQSNSAYLLAQGAYDAAGMLDKISHIAGLIGSFFEHVGDVYMVLGDYFGALGYLNAARLAFDKAGSSVRLDQISFKHTAAQFKGATDRFVRFRRYRFGQTIAVKQPSGGTYWFSFVKLVNAYRDTKALRCLSLGSAGHADCPPTRSIDQAYQSVAHTILDALLFYSALTLPALEAGAIDGIKKTIAAKLPEYISVPGDTSASSTSLLTRVIVDNSAFENVSPEDLSRLCLALFDQFAQLEAYSVKKTGISLWAGQLFAALSARYMVDYLGGQQPQEQFNNLIAALKAHKTELLAPADQYIGTVGV